ncbi:MAG: NADH-quinone oxidoreductase subunit C [Leadbetterella sp.]
MISNQNVVDELVAQFGEKVFAFEEPFGLLTFATQADSLVEVVKFLKEHTGFRFTFLTDVTAVHYPNDTGRELCSVSMLHSWENQIRVRIKTFVPGNSPNVPTLTTLFDSANWMEREAFDFYGVNYVGHPNLKRILNMDEMDYHPMLKQYPLEDATRNDKIDADFGR